MFQWLLNSKQKLRISNEANRPRVIWVEPWGEDFTLLPSEELEIRAVDRKAYFQLAETETYTQVFVEPTYDFSVWQNGCQIECGHNRQTEDS